MLFLENYWEQGCPFIAFFSFVVNATTELKEQIKETSENKLIKLLCQLGVLTPTTLIMLEAGEGLECQQQ